ncbi:hypothetical protein GOP47_0022644 [Adiantum capillus-veneris]|uniref:Uncharacterized protein n=1 Tax=Adiantum capillus-veneris TaxID=13818 RepID=A0A9D4U679_ADICA|nr:hypothetical protein GOP47_0022644 [Adiantum capillus-veneris]
MKVGGNIEGTSRRTSNNSVVYVPSLNEEEAMQALKSYCCNSSFIIPDEYLRKLALSCFFEEQCHPLCLMLRGKVLRQVIRPGRDNFDSQQWITDPMSSEGNAQSSASSLNEYSERAVYDHTRSVRYPPWTFVRLHNDDYTEDRMHNEVLALEYHGLLELIHDDREQPQLVIHDLLTLVQYVPQWTCHIPRQMNY